VSRLRRCVAAAAGLLSLAAANSLAATPAPLAVISFGRADQDALNFAFYGAFGRDTGIPVEAKSYDGQTTELEQMVRAGQPPWSVMQVESGTLHRGCAQGLFEKLDYSRLGDTSGFVPGAVSECGLGIFAWSLALVYSDALATAPRSWADFWDVRRFPGKRGLRRSAKYTLEIALLADGVAPEAVYRVLATEQGQARAFAKLEQIKNDIIWWEAAAQPAVLMAAGNIAMSSAYTLWFDPRQQPHARVAWEASLYDVDSWAIPRGTARLADAYRFIAYASAPERQQALSRRIAYGPANRRALAGLPAELAAALPSSDGSLAHAVQVDADFWLAHGPELERRFDAWAPPICRQQTDDDDDDYQDRADCQDVQGQRRGAVAASAPAAAMAAAPVR